MVAGVAFIIGVTTIVDIALHVVGAWLTARLAPHGPMKHAMVLGYVGVVLGLLGLVATWNPALGPRWYPIMLVVLVIPQSWAGRVVSATDRTG